MAVGAVAATAIAVSSIASSLNLGSCIGSLLELFEILQYLTFLQFLNTEIPPAPGDFISALFQNSIEFGAILDDIIVKLNIKDFHFSFNYDLSVRKFKILLEKTINFLDPPQIPRRRHKIFTGSKRRHPLYSSGHHPHPVDIVPSAIHFLLQGHLLPLVAGIEDRRYGIRRGFNDVLHVRCGDGHFFRSEHVAAHY